MNWGFPGGSMVNNLPANAGDTDLIPGPGRFHLPWSNYAHEPQLLRLCSRARPSFPGGSDGKESVCNAGDPGSIPRLGRSPGEGKATHSSILAWEIPWTEESGRLHSMGWQKSDNDWVTTYYICHREKGWGNVQQKTLDGEAMFTYGYASLTFSIMKIYYFHDKNNNS